jgi:hypothetical protein
MKCVCGRPAEGVAWRWNAIGTKTEEPMCATCMYACRDADRRAGISSDDHGWRWRWYAA